MCAEIARQLRVFPRNLQQTPPKSIPSHREVIEQALESLDLGIADVFTDIGCGDARILIEATRRYGCRSIGVEKDAETARKARGRVKAAESRGEIKRGYVTVLQIEGADFDPRRYGITAGTCYLFPETLKRLSPMLRKIPKLASLHHRVPTLVISREVGPVFVYRNKPAADTLSIR